MAHAIKMLQDDHNSARILFGQIQQIPGGSPGVLEKAVLQLTSMLTTHTKLEEEFIYPVLAEFDPEGAKQAEGDHDEAKGILKHMDDLPDGMELRDVVGQLQVVIEDHVAKEEETLFPLLSEKLGPIELETLGMSMLTRQQELMQEGEDTTGAAETARPQNIYPKM